MPRDAARLEEGSTLIGYSVEDANFVEMNVFYPGKDEASLAEAKRLAEAFVKGFNAPRGSSNPSFIDVHRSNDTAYMHNTCNTYNTYNTYNTHRMNGLYDTYWTLYTNCLAQHQVAFK